MNYNMEEFYKQVNDYSLLYQSRSKLDVPFWQELITLYAPQRVLELACGSGRIGIELLYTPDNFQLEGLDIEPEMLDMYRRKLEQEPEKVQRRVVLHQENMCNYQLEHKGEFDLIFLPFNSIAHLYTREQQINAFKNAFDHLAPEGRFIVDIFHPDINYLSNAFSHPGQVSLEEEVTAPNNEFTLLIYSSRKYDPFEQVQHIIWTYEKFFKTGEYERYMRKLDMHIFFPNELQLLYEISGFHIENIYGGYDRKPLGQGTRQIIIGQKNIT